MSTVLTDTPPGWNLLSSPAGFIETAGPFYWKATESGFTSLSFKVTPKLCNPVGNCHGGMLATFCDVVLAVAVQEALGDETGFLPTVNISCEFLSGARLGSMVISQPEILRVGKRIAVARCVLVDEEGGKLVASTGSFLRVPAGDTPFNLRKLLGISCMPVEKPLV